MDRRTALERLDAVRPGTDDLRQPETAGAAAWIERDPAVAAGWANRQAWDRTLATALDDVPVPTGLRERLLLALADGAEADQTSDRSTRPAPPASGRRLGRRGWIAAASGLAAGLAAGVYFAVPDAPTVTVAEARDAAVSALAGRTALTGFDGGFDPRPPFAWTSRLRFAERPFGVLPSESGRHRGAGYRFASRGPRPVNGVLLTFPAGSVVSPPTAASPEDLGYAVRVRGTQSIAWTADGFVYVCCVDGNLGDLLRSLDGVTV